ncbi:hypothetical protein GCM10010381_38320 [Streptomyces xantholiticus]|nr:hypothetical protein GCM10010381_38320 [Streptomyces xantholiticus]
MVPTPAGSTITSGRLRPLPGPAPVVRPASSSVPVGPDEDTFRRAMIALPAETCRVRTVRAFVSGLLKCWGVTGSDRDSAVLVVSELAGNAAQHGGSEMTVSVSLSDRDLCIDIVDTEPSVDLPRPRGSDADDEHGRGLGIVEYLAEWIDIHAQPESWRCGVGLRVSRTVAADVARAA